MSNGRLFGVRIGRWLRGLATVVSCFTILISALAIHKKMSQPWRPLANDLPGSIWKSPRGVF